MIAFLWRNFMPFSTVNVSFQRDFLAQIDKIANTEARTRSELIREAVRLYIDRKKEKERIFELGHKIALTLDISEDDVMNEIKEHRKLKRRIK
jgi:metal-responsive CopG/Arc/MetJ family transcriptional regulator